MGGRRKEGGGTVGREWRKRKGGKETVGKE